MTTVEINDKIKYMKSLVDGYAIVRWKSESKQDMHNRNLWLGAEEEIQERLNLLKVLNENNINRIHQETFLFLENFVKFLDEEVDFLQNADIKKQLLKNISDIQPVFGP